MSPVAPPALAAPPSASSPLADGSASASRAGNRVPLAAAVGDLPSMAAIITVPTDSLHADTGTLDVQGCSLGESLSHFAPRPGDDALKRGA